MALYTKCILKEKDVQGGTRISIMSRHTLNDGKTPDVRITPDSFDLHYAELAPLPKLLGDYYKRDIPWKEFERRFKEDLGNVTTLKLINEISQLAIKEKITLLCIEETAEKCHQD